MSQTKDQANKILFVASVENHLLHFHIPYMKYFLDKGFAVHVATKLGDRSNELRSLGVCCHDIHFSRSPFSLNGLSALKQLIAVMRSENFSLVHVHTPIGAFWGRLAAVLTNTRPVIYTVHGFHFFKGSPVKDWVLYYLMEKLAARWTDALVMINDEDFRLARRLRLRKDGSLYFIRGVGLSVKQYGMGNGDVRKAVREQMGYQADDILIICVAEFAKVKNHLQILRTIKHIAKFKTNVFLLLIGDGKLGPDLKRSVTRLELNAFVKFLGYRKDIPELLHTSDIFILTSRREGLPKSVMEAMAAGKPVVATDVRGNRDLIEDGVNGFLVPVDDVEKTNKALLKLIENPELRQKMGQNGREMITPYAIEKILQEMEIVYSSILAKEA